MTILIKCSEAHSRHAMFVSVLRISDLNLTLRGRMSADLCHNFCITGNKKWNADLGAGNEIQIRKTMSAPDHRTTEIGDLYAFWLFYFSPKNNVRWVVSCISKLLFLNFKLVFYVVFFH